MKMAVDNLKRWLVRLSLRERAVLMLTLAAALLGVFDVLVYEPLDRRQQVLEAHVRKERAALAELHKRLSPQSGVPEAQAALSLLKARQTELAALDLRLQAMHTDVPAAQLADLLRQTTRHHDRVALLALETATAGGASAPSARQGVKLKVAGRFADLLAFSQALDRDLAGLQWTEMRLEAESSPPTLEARVWLARGGRS